MNQIWVSPTKNSWKVKNPAKSRASAVTKTKAEAKGIGKQIAINQKLEYIEQGKNGKLMEKNTYPKFRDKYLPQG